VPNPVLEVYDGTVTNVIAVNNNWNEDPHASEIAETDPKLADKDAALIFENV
jgi:hypothetical protein